jgi:predicted transcriptional regulator
MINGRRSNEEIKSQLRLPASDIDDALTRLRMLDLIE